LVRRYGDKVIGRYKDKREQVRAATQAYDQAAQQGDFATIYHFGEGLIDESQIRLDQEHLQLPGFAHSIDLTFTNRFADMCD
jgi:acetoacetyl-[acyl-carrier protein] synthase